MSEPMVYYGKTTCCDHIVTVWVDDESTHRKDMSREIARWVRDGLTVEHATLAAFRDMKMARCTCPKARRVKAP